jgi:hypothetical protein
MMMNNDALHVTTTKTTTTTEKNYFLNRKCEGSLFGEGNRSSKLE